MKKKYELKICLLVPSVIHHLEEQSVAGFATSAETTIKCVLSGFFDLVLEMSDENPKEQLKTLTTLIMQKFKNCEEGLCSKEIMDHVKMKKMNIEEVTIQ